MIDRVDGLTTRKAIAAHYSLNAIQENSFIWYLERHNIYPSSSDEEIEEAYINWRKYQEPINQSAE